MAVDRGVLTLGGKGSSLSQTSVFEFANASPPQILKIDPSALVELPSSLSGHKLQSLSSPFKLQLSVPDDLTPEEARASILLLLNTLLFCGSASPSVASQLSDILNNDAQTFTLDLEFDRQDDVDFVKDCWPDIISVAICALLDYAASSLSKVADAVAALSCEVLKTDTTTAFNFFRDSGDGCSDKDSDLNVFLNGSKMCGNTQCDLVSDIRGTHGRLRSVCKLIHSSTRVKLNSIPPVHGGASKDLTRLFSFLASALHDLGEDSWERAKLFLDNLVKDNLFPSLAKSFNADCPNVDKLEDSIISFVAFKKEKSYMKSLREVSSLLEAVRKILSWEATISFISLEGSELIKVEEVVAEAKPDKKNDKKKMALGKGTTILMEFIKDRLESLTSNIDASSLPEKLSNGFLSFLDLKDDSSDQLLQKVKEVVDSNESRRLPKIPEGTCDVAKEQMANIFKRHGAMTRDTPVFEMNGTVAEKYGQDSNLIYDLADQVVTGPRWKGKGSKVKALANPISRSILDLQCSLQKSSSRGILCGDSVLLVCNPEQTNLLSLTCFGEPIITFKDKHDKDKQWFEFTLEEAFYLCFSLKCINILGVDNSITTHNELWNYMISKNASFPDRFKAYSHLRDKNCVVRSGGTYGVDFVVYRHHPSLVHSEYGVLVLSEGNENGNDRLRVWSDIQCTVRLLNSVAKTLLALHVNRNGANLIGSSPSCLDGYSVKERIYSRWSPGSCREDQALGT